MAAPHLDDLLAAHELDYTGMHSDVAPFTCSCGFTGDEAQAAQHARENGLCGDCHGSGEGSQWFGGDGSGIGPCAACGGGGTAVAEDETAKANAELDAAMAALEEG